MIEGDVYLWYTGSLDSNMDVLGFHDGPPPDDQNVIKGVNVGGSNLVKQFQQNQKNHGSLVGYLLSVLVGTD